MNRISGWGNFPEADGKIHFADNSHHARSVLDQYNIAIAHGMGRSYGDAALQCVMIKWNGTEIDLSQLDEGLIKCDAGTTLSQLLEELVPRGYFLPVLPGTKFVSVGGAIAANIHGKNHEKQGSFLNHLLALDLMLANGEIRRCSLNENPELFWNTCGGMGLTGLILSATLRIRKIESAYIVASTEKTNNLSRIMNLFQNTTAEYSVAWIDTCQWPQSLPAIFRSGEHAPVDTLDPGQRNQKFRIHRKSRFVIPFNLPGGVLQPSIIRTFNRIYFMRAQNGRKTVHYNNFFFPLDKIGKWNRIYGRSGLLQFQALFSKEIAALAFSKIFDQIVGFRLWSTLGVIKKFGESNPESTLSFPKEGLVLSLDFQRTAKSLALFTQLHRITEKYSGRIYLAKDACMTQSTFEKGYSEHQKFKEFLKRIDPNGKFQSKQSERLGLK